MAAERTDRGSEGADLVEGDAGSAADRKANPKTMLERIVPGLQVSDSVGQTLLAAVVAWSTTVAPAVFSRSAPRSALFVAVLALLAGLSGPILRPRRPNVARHVGLTLFFLLVTGAWLLASAALEPLRLDPLRASIGAVAWGAFALSWREPWEVEESAPEARHDPKMGLLQARAALPSGAIFILTMGVVASLLFLVLAWNVRDGDRALVAQALAVACAVAITTVAASAAVERAKRSSRSNRRVTPAAGRALLLLFAFVAAGIAVVVLRN